MKQTTKRNLAIGALSAFIIASMSGVFARGGFGPGWGGHHGMMGGPGMYGQGMGSGWMMGGDPADTQQRLEELKARLGINADQETAWNTFADAVAERTGIRQAHRQAMFESGPISPQQRLAFHQQGFAQMQKIGDARRDLYAVLSPEQQARLDTVGGFRTCLR